MDVTSNANHEGAETMTTAARYADLTALHADALASALNAEAAGHADLAASFARRALDYRRAMRRIEEAEEARG